MTVTLEQERSLRVSPRQLWSLASLRPAWLALLLSPWCILVHGYHPYAEDGGVYLASIKRLIDPQLYPAYTGFVTAHSSFSLFPHLIGAIVQATGLPLMTLMFLLYAVSIWMTLFSGGVLASRCSSTPSRVAGAMLLLAAWLSIPVAGTSLMLVDPYVTARSFSTPFSLLALAATLDALEAMRYRHSLATPLSLALVALAACAAMHPLMAIYTSVCMFLLAVVAVRGMRSALFSVIGALAVVALMALLATQASTAYLEVAHSRTYWFLQQWQWFEWIGLLGPAAIFTAAALYYARRPAVAMGQVAGMATCASLLSVATALLFARVHSASMLIASAQPLRQFHLLYCIMILGLGGGLDYLVRNHRRMAWPLIMVAFGALMFFVQRQTYPSSQHIETPWSNPSNAWEQAFQWISNNSPVDAVFAIDRHYISEPGEDSQNFKAIAERSAVPDYSKDGGIAAIDSQLADEWHATQMLSDELDQVPDSVRIARFRGTKVHWIVLPATSQTRLSCPYSNQSVRVCRLP